MLRDFFTRLFRSIAAPAKAAGVARRLSEEEILTLGLAMSLEFGEQWLVPIQARLAQRVPELSAATLDSYQHQNRQAREAGLQLVCDALEHATKAGQKLDELALRTQLGHFLRGRYWWIDEPNVARLYSQGVYYAFKDGLDQCLA